VKTRPFGREARIVIYKCLIWKGFTPTARLKPDLSKQKISVE
jgi:hypothetical protein